MSNVRKISKKSLDINGYYESITRLSDDGFPVTEINLAGEYDVEVQVSGLTAGAIELRTKSVDFIGDDNTYDTLENAISADGTASYTGGNSYLQIVGNGSETGTTFNLRLKVKKSK